MIPSRSRRILKSWMLHAKMTANFVSVETARVCGKLPPLGSAHQYSPSKAPVRLAANTEEFA